MALKQPWQPPGGLQKGILLHRYPSQTISGIATLIPRDFPVEPDMEGNGDTDGPDLV